MHPAVAPSHPTQLFVRKDMRFGPDDPTLWPQQYSREFCHLAAIPKRPIPRKAKAVMWWDPHPNHFISPNSGQSLTRGLGKLSSDKRSELNEAVDKLLDDCSAYTTTITPPAKAPTIITHLSSSLRLGLEQLQNLPYTYNRMVIEVTYLQRCFLELSGTLRYMTVYKPRLVAGTVEQGLPDDYMGVFTSDTELAQRYRMAGLPYWLIRPLTAFANENILEVVKPLEAAAKLELEPAQRFTPVSVGNTLEERLHSLHLCTSPQFQPPLIRRRLPVYPTRIRPPLALHLLPFARATRRGRHLAPERDKFLPFEHADMPPTIPSWTNALAKVNRSHVFPEPAILVSPVDEGRHRMYLHHYQLVHDALVYRFGDPNDSQHPLRAQE
ncbi:hypothetical protein B0H19DRAFT_1265225 [Mycena capillaripes]|nr:hypothetical protein B0H19DRAFT_1265225 [Mycena capillaripes]